MPKLRDETYAARRAHILDAARTCFARKGFHAASMHDLQAEAGVSAGAIYVYFRSKDDIVTAIAEDHLDRLDHALEQALSGRDGASLRDTLVGVLAAVERVAEGPSRGIAFDVWGEATRDGETGRIARERLGRSRERLVDAARRAITAGELPVAADAEQTGAALFAACVPGYYTQRLVLGDGDPAAYADGLLAAVAVGTR